MVKNIYKEIQLSLKNKHNKLFNEVTIDMCISPVISGDHELSSQYEIFELKVNTTNSCNESLNQEVKHFVAHINQQISTEQQFNRKNWKLFYLIKEILQKFVGKSESGNFNYFRGQACDWSLTPGIFRDDTSENFIENFENIYKAIAYEYPGEITYIEYDKKSVGERSKQLSLLQHYGLRTSLVDVTKNPYIALLFMVSDNSRRSFNRGTIDLYRIDEEKHGTFNIFMPVAKSDHNKRLTAQKGAFFNYDILFDLKQTEVEVIDRIILRIDYPHEAIREKIKLAMEDSSEELNEIKKKYEELNLGEGAEFYSTFQSVMNSMQDLLGQYERLYDEVETLEPKIFSFIREEVKEKLGEYFYFENALFPDLDKYISYIQTSYIDDSKKKKLNLEDSVNLANLM